MNRKQKIIVSTTGIFLVLLILVGLTYAYFLTRINGNTNDKSISVSTANLELTYKDNIAEILGKDLVLEPSDTEIGTKTFTVTNNGNDTSYVVVIENVSITKTSDGSTTTFESNDFRYTLTCTKNDGSSCDGVSTQSIFPINGGVLVGNSIKEGDVHTYTFKMWYIDTGIDQSNDMGKTIQARLNITNLSSMINPYSANTNSLAYNIIENAKNKTNGTELVSSPLTQVANEINGIDEKVLSVTNDDYGISYYYRGNVIDNYVNFAGMCWKIIRIAGDGSIKIILEDQDQECSETMDGNWNIPTIPGGNILKGNFGYTEYAIGELTATDGTQNSEIKYLINYLNGGTNNEKSLAYTLENYQEITNGDDRSLKDKITKKYNKDITNYLKVGDWCINNNAYSKENGDIKPLNSTELLDGQIKGKQLYFDSYVRLFGKTIKEPTLKCNGMNMNKFADNTDMYVGAITADEIVYAGGKVRTVNSNYYLINNYQKTNILYFLSLSTSHFYKYYDGAFNGNYTGSVSYTFIYNNGLSFRPVVSLLPNTKVSSGNGTKEAPYIVS